MSTMEIAAIFMIMEVIAIAIVRKRIARITAIAGVMTMMISERKSVLAGEMLFGGFA